MTQDMKIFKTKIASHCAELRAVAQSPIEHVSVKTLSAYLDKLIASDDQVKCSELRNLIVQTFEVYSAASGIVRTIDEALVDFMLSLLNVTKDLNDSDLSVFHHILSEIGQEISTLLQRLPIQWQNQTLTFSVEDVKPEFNDENAEYYRWHLLYSAFGITRALEADRKQQEGWLNAARYHLGCALRRTNPDSRMADYVRDVTLQVLRAMEAAGMRSRFEEASTAYSWPKDHEVWPTSAKRARADAGGAGSAKRPRLGGDGAGGV